MQEYSCSNELVLEEYLLGANFSENDRQTMAEHLSNCSGCRKIYRDWILFYEILETEIQKPISNKILDLGYRLYPNPKSGAIWIGMHQENVAEQQGMLFRISTGYNLGANPQIQKFSDLNLHNIPKDAVIIRTITDHTNGDTFLYLYSTDGIRLSNCELVLRGHRICKTNITGTGRLLINPEDLRDKIIAIYFETIEEFDLSMTEKYALAH